MGRGLRRAGASPRDPRWLTQAWGLPRRFRDLGFPANHGLEWTPRAHMERYQVLTLVNCILPSASCSHWIWAKESMSSTGLNFPYLYNQSDLRPITERDGDPPTLWSFFPLVFDGAWHSPPITLCTVLSGLALSWGWRVCSLIKGRED